jgi:hypothetical protein
VGAAVISGGDAAPVLEPAEHALDQIALLVDLGIVYDRHLAVLASGNAGRDVQTGQSLAEPVAVVTLVGDQDLGVRQRLQDGSGAAIVADLALGEQQDQWLALAVTDGVQLGVQAALGPSDAAGNSPFLRRLAAVR